MPHFYLSIDCHLEPLLTLRRQLNADLAGSGIRLSVNDLLMKALAIALTEVPDANVQFAGDRLYRFERIDISMAVANPHRAHDHASCCLHRRADAAIDRHAVVA